MRFFGGESESIFLKSGVLNYSHVPENVLFRDDERSVIAECVKPLLRGQKAYNLFIHGDPGLGKTLCSLDIIRKLEDYSGDVKCVYINCWDSSREYQALVDVGKALGYFFYQGKSSDDVFREIVKRVERIKGLVLVLDEVDKLRDTSFIYRFADALEGKVSLILIANDKDFLLSLEPRIVSRLSVDDLHFKAYSLQEVKEILKARCSQAFRPGAFSDLLLNRVVRETYNACDIRVGLFLLLRSVRIAESNERSKVEQGDVDVALKKLSEFRIKTSLSKLSESEQIIIGLVSASQGLVSGMVFEEYVKEGGKLTKRSFRRSLEKLERLGLLRTEFTGKGVRGQTRKIFLGGKLKYTKLN
ncbi:MAG: AAA family ATPase [Nanoarchaeota archaeon]|nr:AAA family ATPase [Nanoarchaeota archaeon]